MTRVWMIVDHSTCGWERRKERFREKSVGREKREMKRIREWTTIDKCILLAYHLYAWAFALPGSLTLLRRMFNVRLLQQIEWKSFLVDLTVVTCFNRNFRFKPCTLYPPLLSRPLKPSDVNRVLPLKKTLITICLFQKAKSLNATLERNNTLFLNIERNVGSIIYLKIINDIFGYKRMLNI